MKILTGLAVLMVLTAGSQAFAASHQTTIFIEEQDTNKDGQVTLAEFDVERADHFKRMDANGDASLTEAEYVGEYEARLNKQLESVTDAEKKKEQYQRQMRQAKVRFGVLDTNKDAAMTFEEYQVSGHAMFNRHDADKSGIITAKDVELLTEQKKDKKGDDFVNP
ncbi:hypothetical protein [Asticcacaulis endophyticus]|uniref:EF-hand domain-containing protein n=1 Tax=Asticcacaulis endophyticus TaxID=1395890 RepID=A0A918QAX1_9CAUL|nr:hypothetical protein [Asticcacaulis endophyticus]GGZ37528.1 hypothetical protein GCM10011273_24970 [Asticcacaulis endophyticus]